MLSFGADIAAKDTLGMTALMVACREKKEAAAAELMKATKNAGALDVQRSALNKRSALHFASTNGWESAVGKLLSLCADVALKDKYDKGAFDQRDQ